MIFIDASAWIAYFLRKDQNHPAAAKAWPELRKKSPVFTSNFVLDETFTYVGLRAGSAFAAEQAVKIYSSASLTILRPDESDEIKALELFRKFADQSVSFTDCTSFVLMRTNGIKPAFTFDTHFEIAGFELWPPRR